MPIKKQKPTQAALIATPEGESRVMQPAPQVDAATQSKGIEAMLMAAIDKGLDIAVIERLMAMRKELKAEFAKEAYLTAMAAFQAECPVIKKDKPVSFTTKAGQKVSYAYAPMDSLVSQAGPMIGKNGFSYKFELEESATQIKATCYANHAAGHQDSSFFTADKGGTDLMSAAQKASGAATYAKRIAFCNVFGIATGDEDVDAAGNAAPAKTDAVPATNEQKEEIDRLTVQAKLEKVYVTTKCQEIYGVSWTQLNKNQADGLISMLKKKIAANANTPAPTK